MSRLASLAARNVARNRRRTFITLSAIGIGVCAALQLQAVRLGFVSMLVKDVVEGDTGAFQIHRHGYMQDLEAFPNQLNMPYSEEFISRLKKLPHVKGVTGRIQFSGMVSNGRSQTMFVGKGIDPATEKEACPRTATDLGPGGAPLSPGDGAVVLVGEQLAQSFGAVTPAGRAAAPREKQGELVDTLTLSATSPTGRANAIDVRVKGLTRAFNGFENKRVVTLPLPVAQDLVALRGKVTEYAVAIDDIEAIDDAIASARQALGPEYDVDRWDDIRPFFRDIIFRMQIVLGAITLILVVIVVTGIINTMLMSVFERVREIGTMLALGVRRSQILFLFVVEALVIGTLGGAAGAAAGTGLVAIVGRIGIPFQMIGSTGHSMLRPHLSWHFPALMAGGAVVGSLLSALYPAWRASRLRPVEALRST